MEMVDGLSVRKVAKKCGVDKTTSFWWRHRFLHGLRDKKDRSLKGMRQARPSSRSRSKVFVEPGVHSP